MENRGDNKILVLILSGKIVKMPFLSQVKKEKEMNLLNVFKFLTFYLHLRINLRSLLSDK